MFLVVRAEARLKRWLRKTEPRLVAEAYALSRPIQESVGGLEQLKHQEVFMLVKSLLDDNVSNPFIKMPYLSAAERLYKISRNYYGDAAKSMATAEVAMWVRRGLDVMLLVAIARLFSLEVMVEDVVPVKMVTKFEVIPHEGTLTIEQVNVPYTVLEFVHDRLQAVEGRIKVRPLGAPDRIQITEYEKLSPTGDWEILNDSTEDVSLISPETVFRIPKKYEKYGYKVEIRALDIAPRVVEFNFQRVLLE